MVHDLSGMLNIFPVAPTNGHVKVKVHDEAYARVHLGFIGTNIEFFLARVCFKGGAEYSINILQVVFKRTCVMKHLMINF